jgi:uncharacterized protein
MERTLTDFIRALRSAGAQVSSSEAIDAANALALIGYEDRQLMKDSLSVVLAKSEEEKLIHDQLFEAFFSRRTAAASAKRNVANTANPQAGDSDSQDQTGASAGQAGESGDPLDGRAAQAGSAGASSQTGASSQSGQDSSADATAFLELAQSGDADRIAVALERAGSAVGVDEIRFSSQTPYYVRRILEHLGVEALEAQLSARILDRARASQAQAKILMDARTTLQRHARAYVDQRFELFGKSATESFMNDVVVNREIGQLGLRDMERMKALVARMAKRLAVRHSRRRKVRNRGQLDVRRTMRANAGNDGIPFQLVWKLKRRDRPKIVAICDVSGSVSQYVRFLLLFLYALKDEVTDLGAFAFSARLKDVSHELETLSFEKAIDSVINEVGGGGTDYGQALVDLKDRHWEVIDRRTTILILGDGRSNNTDPRLDIFQEAVDRAKRVVWLCPEPPRRWGTGDSCVLQYKPFCTHLSHCATALDLERALDEVLMAYD